MVRGRAGCAPDHATGHDDEGEVRDQMSDATARAEALMAAAAETTGLDDFGHPSFRTGLEELLASLEADGALNDIGRASADQTCATALVNRLRVTDWCTHHPEVTAAPVEAPLFVIGLPRTGTTALSHLLAADPANRSLLGWEANESVPPPARDGYRDDPRFVAAREAPDMLAMINPEFKAIHHDPPDMPVECAVVLAQHFASLSLPTMFNIEGYLRWLLAADHTHAYGYHRQVLQVLQSRYPGRWQLKSPVHLVDLDALAATYPDARFVVTHRDPVPIVASVCSLVRSLTGTFSDADRTAYIAATWPDLVATLVERQMSFRDRHDPAAFCDVPYEQVRSDPVGAVRAVYDRFGLELTPGTEQRVARHAAANRQGQHGRHRYSLEEFGLSAGAIEERFADYRSRYL